MLAADKVKIHGISDERWTTRDKLNQIHGLLALKKRDEKQAAFDLQYARQRQAAEIQDLKKDISKCRSMLETVKKSGEQQMRNILRADRATQLALSKKPLSTAIDHLEQSNFVKCKELNSLRFKKIQLMRILLNLKLESNRVQNMILCEAAPANIKREQTLSNLIGRTLVKQDAARSVSFTYTSILEVLKKDAMYFTAILNTLQKEVMNQCMAILKVTTVGQECTEGLADVEEELRSVEEQLKRQMQDRSEAVNEMRSKVEHNKALCKDLVHVDESTTNLAMIKHVEGPDAMETLIKELQRLEGIMQKLRNATLSVDTDCIFPRIEGQMVHRDRLLDIIGRAHRKKDFWLKRRNHAEVMLEQIMHNMGEFTKEYVTQKNSFKKEIEEKRDMRNREHKEMEELGRFMIMMRTAFYNINAVLSQVNTPENADLNTVSKQFYWDSEDDVMKELYAKQGDPDPHVPKLNAMKLLQSIYFKLGLIMDQLAGAKHAPIASRRSFAFKARVIVEQPPRPVEDALKRMMDDESEANDPSVPTRAEIKAQSRRIVEYNEKLADMPPEKRPRKNRRDIAKWLCAKLAIEADI